MGGGHLGKDSTRQLATTMIGVAEERKDAVAFISPSRDQILSDTSTMMVQLQFSVIKTSLIILQTLRSNYINNIWCI